MSADLSLVLSPVLSLTLLRFSAACAGSLVIGFLLTAGLRRAAARWPALYAHRSVWLLAQAVLVLAFALACAPLPRDRVAPTLTLSAIEDDTGSAAPLGSAPQAAPRAVPAVSTQAAPPSRPAPGSLPWMRRLAVAALVIYLGGLACVASRRWRHQRQWRRMLRGQTRRLGAAALVTWPGLTRDQRERIARAGIAVRTTDLPVSPMVYGLRRPTLLLPAHLGTLAADQQHLIIEHELTHWRRADPLWLALSSLFALLFWFNRPFQQLDAALREAVELGCDDTVLAGRDARERQGYAAALVAQLRLQLAWQPGAAFGQLGVAHRMLRMRERSAPRLSRRARLLVAAASLGVGACGAVLQPAFSALPAAGPESASIPAGADSAPVLPPSLEPWRYPVERVRVTALYGVRSPSVPDGHHGVDFAARRGTPVHAVADGVVAEAAYHPTWGNYVRVDHGGGRSSLLIHLERVSVAHGERVVAGTPLGTAGASGKATGPHLHLEYWQDGKRLDPETVLTGLPGHATATALARREAQGRPLPLDH